MGKDPFGIGIAQRYAPGLVPQGISAELVASKWRIGREELDEYAVRSHHLAGEAADSGHFDDEIVSIALVRERP